MFKVGEVYKLKLKQFDEIYTIKCTGFMDFKTGNLIVQEIGGVSEEELIEEAEKLGIGTPQWFVGICLNQDNNTFMMWQEHQVKIIKD